MVERARLACAAQVSDKVEKENRGKDESGDDEESRPGARADAVHFADAGRDGMWRQTARERERRWGREMGERET